MSEDFVSRGLEKLAKKGQDLLDQASERFRHEQAVVPVKAVEVRDAKATVVEQAPAVVAQTEHPAVSEFERHSNNIRRAGHPDAVVRAGAPVETAEPPAYSKWGWDSLRSPSGKAFASGLGIYGGVNQTYQDYEQWRQRHAVEGGVDMIVRLPNPASGAGALAFVRSGKQLFGNLATKVDVRAQLTEWERQNKNV